MCQIFLYGKLMYACGYDNQGISTISQPTSTAFIYRERFMRKSALFAVSFAVSTTVLVLTGLGNGSMGNSLTRNHGLALQSATAQPVAATTQQPTNYTLMGVSFESPEPFSAPMPMPQESVAILYPATATPGNEDFKVTLRSLPPKDLVSDSLTDQEFSQWARVALLGKNRPPVGQIERTILGRRLIGDVQLEQSRRQTVSELFVLSLTSGHRLLITFESNQQLSLPKMERFIGHIASSMQEIPANSKAWRESFRLKTKK
jgi:hypothetical protein